MRNLLLSLAVLAALPISDAAAWNMLTQTWPTSTVTVKVNPDVQITLSDHFDVLLAAEAKVNANASALRFDLVVDNDAVSAPNNGENELAFTNDAMLLCSIGCTWIVWNATSILEADVFLKLGYAWTLDDLKTNNLAYGGPARPLINAAMHEFLHTMGALHENAVINIMGEEWNVVSTNGDYTEVVVSEDTTHGLQTINGVRATAIHDVSVMHWKFDSPAGAYSRHTRSQLLDLAGNELPHVFDANGEPIYSASPGDQIQVEMTLENRGTATEETELGVYWSSSSLISTQAMRLSSSNPTLRVNVPYERTATITVPAGTLGQTYYVGVIIDRLDAISEMNEINNAAYIAAIELQ